MPNSKEEILNEHFPEGVRIPEFASSMQNLTLNSIGTEYINMEAEYEHIELFGKSALFTMNGCGGSLDEWVDGINDMLTKDGILLDGTKFHDCFTFTHNRITCLLFPFTGDVKLDPPYPPRRTQRASGRDV